MSNNKEIKEALDRLQRTVPKSMQEQNLRIFNVEKEIKTWLYESGLNINDIIAILENIKFHFQLTAKNNENLIEKIFGEEDRK